MGVSKRKILRKIRKMGYEVTRFICEIDQEFMCTICTMVLEDAMQSPCDHLFCKECILGWLAADRSCPVDRGALEAVDLKPVARFFRNLLEKFMIKCDFGKRIEMKMCWSSDRKMVKYVSEQQGCETVVQLEHLQTHIINCTRNPNAEVVCDKGCNLKMRLHEYETHNCLTQISSRLIQRDLEISRLNALTTCLEEENRQLNDELNRQREENKQINDANRRLRLQINQFLLKWQRSENIKFSGEAFDVLETDNKSRTVFAQLAYSLESDFSSGYKS